jgi:signal transduction histidine kinase
MLKGLRIRVILIQSTVIATALLLIGMVLYQIQKNNIINQFLDEAKTTDMLVQSQIQENEPHLRRIVKTVQAANVSPLFSSITLAANNDKTAVAKITQSLRPAFSDKVQSLLKGCKPGFINMSNMHLISVSPVYTSDGNCINLAIVSNSLHLTKRLLLLIEILGAYILLNFFILTIVAWFIIDRYAIMPLRRFEQAVEGVSSGDYPQMKDMPDAAELHQIVKAFNTMTSTIQAKEQRLKDTIKELKETQSLIIKREKLATIGSFASGISHEIGNPLSAIISLLETVKTGIVSEGKEVDRKLHQKLDKKLDQNLDQKLDMISRSLNEAYRIDALIKQLLLYVRQKPTIFSDVNVKALCDDVIVSAGLSKNLRDIDISIDAASGTACKTDYEKLRQVLLNLIINAVDAMHAHGRLYIKAAVFQGQLILEISDTGEGIEKAYIDKIFDPFFTTKGLGKGTGLGLAIVKNIIQELHGEISVNSKKGEGTTFMIKIPMSQS